VKNQRKAYLYAFSAICCWCTIGSATKLTLRFIDVIPLLFLANLVAVLVLFAILCAQKRLRLLAATGGPVWRRSALQGLLNPFLYYLVLFAAYDRLPAQEAGTLNYFWPVLLVLLSVPMLHQKISPWSIAAILISFTGLVIISTHGDITGLRFSSPAGVALALGSAVFWAVYWILNMKDPRDNTVKLFFNFLFGLVYVTIVFLGNGETLRVPWQGIAGAVYLGLFEMGITFFLWMQALNYSTTTAKVSNLIYLSPFLSLILIRFAVGEPILLSTVTGLALIVVGILLQQYLRK
jgi:drug/metabolite transporter (DMT)-like permease